MAQSRKNFLASIVSLTLLSILVSSTMFPHVSARVALVCPKLTYDVTIDGKWSSAQEWTDALELPLTFADTNAESYFSMKHDNNSFYVLVDYVSRTKTAEGDNALVVLDTQNDGGKEIRDDDLAILVRWNTTTVSMAAVQWHGWKGKDWQLLPSGFEAKSSTQAQDDPHSTAPHEIYEFRIPKTTFKAAASRLWVGIGRSIGGAEGYLAWYPLVDTSFPDNWAQLEFPDKTLAQLTITPPSTSTTFLSSTPQPTETATPTTNVETATDTAPGQIGYVIFVGVVIAGIVATTLLLRKKK